MTGWRYIAQRATTGEFLDMELPLRRDALQWALSGAGSLRGSVSPDTGALRAADGRPLLEEWGTLIYAEADGEIRWGGIVVSSGFDGAVWQVEAAGFATYPHGMPYSGVYSQVGADPADAVRHIWGELQGHPDGNLGVSVVGSTAARIGTTVSPDDSSTGPYVLNWWDAVDCGQEIGSLAADAPFDFTERHTWSGDSITHEIVVGYPRLGRRRTDLAFIQGDNISEVVTPTLDGEDFANEVVGIGAGEGSKAVRRTTAVRDGRLRRASVYAGKDVTSPARMDSIIRGELQRRGQTLNIRAVTVTDHPNAPIGSWDVGDDILVQAIIPWLGEVSLWCRVVGWELSGEHTATLSLVRSDSFTYGAV